jgi:hypothetical protein
LQADLTVDGIVHLGDCSGLSILPPGLTIGRGLNLAGCSRLSLLPDDLMIEGYLVLECERLTALLPGLCIGGSLFLAHRHGIVHLPVDASVAQDLEVHGCQALRTLPAHLRLGGSLQLDHLPAGLRVHNYVSIRGCPRLAHLTETDIKRMTGARHVVIGGDVPY